MKRRAFRPHSLRPAILIAFSTTAGAQQEPQINESEGLEVITVTARKRVEPLQETPVAITAFTANGLDRKGIDDISGIAAFTPNLVYDTHTPIGGASSAAAVFIRGIGNTDFSLTTDPGVGTYVDGIYVSRSIGGVLDVLDVAGIEVLRGPQGTLFGRNTIGGAINITSRKPYDELAGHAQVTVGSFNRLDFRGSIDLPITSDLLSTFAISRKTRDGYVDRVLVGDQLGGMDRLAFRGAFYYEPSDEWNFQLAIDLTDYDEESAAGVSVGFTPGAGTIGNSLIRFSDLPAAEAIAVGLADLQQYVTEPGEDKTYGVTGNESTVEAKGASFIANYLGDDFDVKYTTSYRETDATFYADADSSPFEITDISNPNYHHEQTSHELQITGDLLDGALKYVGGIYRFDEKGNDWVFVNLNLPTPDLSAGFPAVLHNLANVDNSSQAYYFQGNWAATDQFNLTLGGRYTKDKKEYSYTQFIAADKAGNGLPFFPGAVIADGTFKPGLLPLVGDGTGVVNDEFDETTFKFGADYSLNDNALLYYSFSQGFKSGGFVLRYVEQVENPRTFQPETLDAHELGIKWESDDRKVRVNAAAFYTDYSDVQVIFFDKQGGPITANAGEAEIKGLELEVNALLTEGLLFELGYGYTKAEYTKINPVEGLSLTIDESAKLVNTPEHSLNASLEYRHSFGDDELSIRADYSYTDDLFNDSQNSPFLFQDAHSLVNASVSYTFNYDWELILFVENLTDRRVIESGNSNFGLGFHEARFNRPREYGTTLRYKF
ncbi:TonB-dependent receptor [Shewanella corallii]|uniref:TonB-dependent receptor n=1 Tax=Shewanella corallii TaxID=560080 RepID=A0ABT0NC53_9GAMM|nr:TonB-dependent receptor [Shewanella corallii]MCL2916023.1 TonB-dependent receptor [Shewanella corallii]